MDFEGWSSNPPLPARSMRPRCLRSARFIRALIRERTLWPALVTIAKKACISSGRVLRMPFISTHAIRFSTSAKTACVNRNGAGGGGAP
jgi:hypothetical protein